MTMRVREVCFLIGEGDAILWADTDGSPGALPDSRQRWKRIWNLRGSLVEIAHSHPHGPAAFSDEDETTMAALDAALGVSLRYSVVAPDRTIARCDGDPFDVDPEPWWAELMRVASGMKPRTPRS